MERNMLSKRIVVCLDVREGKTTKGIKFKGNIDIGDPVAMAREYYDQGVDELVFYDITASSDKRDIIIDVVREVARNIFIPFSVGGGIRSVDDMRKVLLAGAEKVSGIEYEVGMDVDAALKGGKALTSELNKLEKTSATTDKKIKALNDRLNEGKRQFTIYANETERAKKSLEELKKLN